jgi:hypothetical protein
VALRKVEHEVRIGADGTTSSVIRTNKLGGRSEIWTRLAKLWEYFLA